MRKHRPKRTLSWHLFRYETCDTKYTMLRILYNSKKIWGRPFPYPQADEDGSGGIDEEEFLLIFTKIKNGEVSGVGSSRPGAADLVALQEEARSKAKKEKIAEKALLLGYSFGILSPKNRFRRFCAAWARNEYWESFILVSIIISSLLLAIDGPTADKTSEQGKLIWGVIDQVDYAFVIIFTVEASLKLVAVGLLCESKDAYLNSTWNMLDIFLVSTAWLGMAGGGDGGGGDAFRTLRSLRALRPLRTIQRAPGEACSWE